MKSMAVSLSALSSVTLTTLAFIATLSADTNTAAAEQWSHTKEFQRAKSASIRIVEPEGYKVSVGDTADTVPAVFKFENDNNYHTVTITAPDGETWKKKIEVRAYKETVLRVTYKGDAKKETPAKTKKKGRTYIGSIKNTCRKKVFLRYDFLLGGEQQATRALNPKEAKDLTLPKGSYEVRVFTATRSKRTWKFHKTLKADITADGWKFHPGC